VADPHKLPPLSWRTRRQENKNMANDLQELMATVLSGEIDRFWTRFNIFAAVQVGAVVGILAQWQVISHCSAILRGTFMMLIVFSITGIIVMLRGFDVQRSFVLTLQQVEMNIPEDDRLFAISVRTMRFPLFTTNIVCLSFGIFSLVLWIVCWAWIECSGIPQIPSPLIWD
jgi:hypothetical protein